MLLDPAVAVEHPDPTYRKDTAKFFAGRTEMIPHLEQLLLDSDGEVRKTAAEASRLLSFQIGLERFDRYRSRCLDYEL